MQVCAGERVEGLREGADEGDCGDVGTCLERWGVRRFLEEGQEEEGEKGVGEVVHLY